MASVAPILLALALTLTACGRKKESTGETRPPSEGTPTPMAGAAGGDQVGSSATAPEADPRPQGGATVDPGTPGSTQGTAPGTAPRDAGGDGGATAAPDAHAGL